MVGYKLNVVHKYLRFLVFKY